MVADVECDLLIVGSGVAGLSTAITAAHRGLHVLLVERDEEIGGTGALSGGWLYLPGNTRGAQQFADTREDITAYLQGLAGTAYQTERVTAFLDAIPGMMEFFERNTSVRFAYPAGAPDYHMDLPGARPGGRAVFGEAFDARTLGDKRLMLRPPLSSMSVLGVVPQIGPDFDHFLLANQSVRSFAYVARRILRNWGQRLRYRRGTELSNGNALVGRLLKSADDAGVEIRTRCRVQTLLSTDGAVTGATVSTALGPVTISARSGVVLACGGFGHDPHLRAEFFRQATAEQDHHSITVSSNDGEAVRLGNSVSASLITDLAQPAAWAPVTRFRGPRGSTRLFPHLRGIGLPGIIAVNQHGNRFANEADSYHDFGQAMIADCADEPTARAFLIADAKTMHRYGLGYAKPWPMPRLRYRSNGYLHVGSTLAKLATATGIDPAGLTRTVNEFNRAAREGNDPQFHRGESDYNTFRGDKNHRPNPSLGPLEKGPFYATEITVTDLGTFAGLATDAKGRALDHDGHAIPGLYAVGSAAASVFGGAYPGYGAMLGPGMTFGYIIGHDVATTAPRHSGVMTV